MTYTIIAVLSLAALIIVAYACVRLGFWLGREHSKEQVGRAVNAARKYRGLYEAKEWRETGERIRKFIAPQPLFYDHNRDVFRPDRKNKRDISA